MEWIQPMEPILIPEVRTGDGWMHEIKWDGIRGMSYVQNGRMRLYTKRGNERTAFYPELAEVTELLGAGEAVLDGEIVVFDSGGNPSFYSSLVRERVQDVKKVSYYSRLYPAKYILFDILALDGRDLTRTPLSERKRMLEAAAGRSGNITLTDSYDEGRALYELMKAKNWEGIVSKKKDSPYVPGKGHDLWFKTKLSRKMLAVVGGIQWKTGMPNSILLGVYREGTLVFIGKAGLGLNQEQLYLLGEQAAGPGPRVCPFAGESMAGVKGDFTWLDPALTCWVHFMEFTADGQMRHPKILGFSQAKPFEANGKEYVQ